MVTGTPMQYVASGGFIDAPSATDITYRRPHPEPKPKPTGLDWAAHTPTCKDCGTRSGQIGAAGLCPGCLGTTATVDDAQVNTSGDSAYVTQTDDQINARFTAPTQTPQGEAASDDAAAIPADESGSELHHEQPAHPRPAAPTVRAKVSSAGTHHVVIAIRSLTDPIDQVAVAALLHDLLTALQADTPHTPAATPTAAGRTQVGKPTQPSGFQTFHRPPRRRKPANTFPLDQARALYLDEQLSCPQIADRLGCAVSTVQRHLKAAGTPMRDDRTHRSGGHNRFTPTAHLAGTPLTDTIRDDVVRRYRDGASLAALAALHHVKTERLRHVLVEAGVTIRPRGGRENHTTSPNDVPASEIRAWAFSEGLLEGHAVGRLPRRVLDAYAAAHPTEAAPTEGDTAA